MVTPALAGTAPLGPRFEEPAAPNPAIRACSRKAKAPPLPDLVPPGEHPTSVRVRAPLSIANVGPGFDHFGLCLEGPADVLELRTSRASGLEVYGDAVVPRDLRRNVATVAAQEVYRQSGLRFRVEARLFKGYHGGSGIGSSGASAVAGALAAAALLGLDPREGPTLDLVVHAALCGERVASGSAHLDNVAASLFGGFVLVEGLDPPIVHRLPTPDGARIIVALPTLRVSTSKARALLPATVPHQDAVANVARASALVHGLLTGDLEQVGRNLSDRLAEPYREPLVPGLASAKQAALEAGAWGVALAGSGPAVFALGPPDRTEAVGAALREGFGRAGVPCHTFTSQVGEGASLVGWS
ncbi:MAG: homoserine kinase [Euryarchaeota archaeon]|nr:homoserine kinase [Euryarchaeota archaeon]MDE1837894.1 homoserine kinase [Euryarchaeota archaeon]MDE1881302.1 homoserine kinase [Euryarchaeota archaeon]MDE2046240.1 homoserine kinase [Thermoplasmata archaeon]